MPIGTKSSLRDYLIKQLPSATAFINTDFKVVHASDQWIDTFNFSATEVFGSTIFDLFGSPNKSWRRILQSCFKGQPTEIDPSTYVDHNNDQIWIQWQNIPWYDENENVIGAIIQAEEVTQSVNNQLELEKLRTCHNSSDDHPTDAKTAEGEILLKTLIDNLPLNVFIKDLDSKKVLVNKSECEYLGVEHPEELLGKSDFDLYDREVAQISRDEDLQVMRSLTPILGRETANKKKDGKTTTFLTSKIPLIGEDGAVKGLVGISLDISDLKQKEEELRDLINVTSLQNKKLINFAHIISHNLRSHAANFAMLLDFFVNERDTVEKNRLTGMLIEASDNLLETLENLNEVVAINANTNLNKKPVYLTKTVAKVVQSLSAFLKTNNAKITNDISEDVQVNVIPAYLESILMNFITNGVKYKEPSRDPILKLSAIAENGNIVLSISDNGLGIDLKKYGDKLFGMYKTFHHHKDARGIGLYITKNQIEAMGGRVTAQSTVGKGTTFKIYFNGKN
ncbi:MAG: sensor histidine kinase [Aurantibacter sp.]